MKFKKIEINFLAFILGLVFLASCNDLPTELGYSLVDDTVSIALITSNDTNLISSHENYLHKLKIFNSGATYIGRAGNLKANTFYRFGGIPDSMPNLNNIQSAELIMYPRKYTFGDTNSNTLSFNIYEINNLWTNEFTMDSLDNNPGFLGTKILGSYSKTITTVDSNLAAISMDIDKDLIFKWLKMQSDTNTAKLNYGIALIPNSNSNVIRQFSAQQIGDANAIAYLKVKYLNDSLKLDSLIMDASIEFSCITKPTYLKDEIQMQGGTGLRSKIYFDLTMLPDLAAIHKSELQFTLDKSGIEKGNIAQDTAISLCIFSETDTLQENPLRTFIGNIDRTTGKMVCQSISSGLETWMRGVKKGYLVAGYYGINTEHKRLDKYTFYGSKDSDPSKRPYLKLIYSKRLRSSSNVK
jgi:hypothetical protein